MNKKIYDFSKIEKIADDEVMRVAKCFDSKRNIYELPWLVSNYGRGWNVGKNLNGKEYLQEINIETVNGVMYMNKLNLLRVLEATFCAD